jgi:hypothetical protein
MIKRVLKIAAYVTLALSAIALASVATFITAMLGAL